MIDSSIQLHPPFQPVPRRAHIPYARAMRWRSPMESLGEAEPKSAVSVFATQTALKSISEHANSDLSNEVGGWLIGKWRADKETQEQFIIVETSLPAQHTRQGSAFLTFTQDTQVSLHAELEKGYPGKELVGWYHTHPGIGIFLSEYDLWLHQNFYPQPYQVALVIEPYSGRGGFFIRQADGKLDARQYFGFYEINHASERSAVVWQNLVPELEHNQGV